MDSQHQMQQSTMFQQQQQLYGRMNNNNTTGQTSEATPLQNQRQENLENLNHVEHNIDEQALRLVQEPFVKRIEEMFKLVKEKLKGQPKILHQFMGHCRQFGSEEEDYETPIIQIFNLLGGDEDLCNLFIQLLPEQFVNRMFPHVTQKLTENFERFVEENTSAQTYHAFHQIVLEHYNGDTSVSEFRTQLEALFEGYPQILGFLPTFYCESQPSEEMTTPPKIEPKDSKMTDQIVQNGFVKSKSAKEEQQEEEESPALYTSADQKAQKQSKNDKQVLVQKPTTSSGEIATETQQAAVVSTTKGKQAQQQIVQNKIPEALLAPQLNKAEVNFFLEQIPEMLKSGKAGSAEETNSTLSHFKRLFYLYVEGVITQCELFELLGDFIEQSGGEKFAILQDLVNQRDASRREGNQLLKPISEVDIGQFRVCNKVAPSYYKLPPDYLVPVCSGRFSDINAQNTLNDKYCSITSGTEDYKFKIKNVHEDNLFKNEDDMYRIDHSILQLVNIIAKLEKEQGCAKEWLENQQAENVEKPGKYMPKYLRDVNFSFIYKWYEENFSSDFMQQRRRNVDLSKVFTKKPVEIIDVWLKRLKGHKDDLVRTKEDKFEDWKHLCQQNFTKSLDHRSFFFKKEQKDLLPNKKQLEELKQISSTPLSKKSECQLKGGSSASDEFYSTYASFKLKNLPAYSPEALQAESLVSDHPINLRDSRFMDPLFRDKLPQMRFLLNDTPILETVFRVLIQSLRVGVTGKERSKIEDILDNLAKNFFNLKTSYESLYQSAKQIEPLDEEEISALSAKTEVYYEQKLEKGWKMQEQLKNSNIEEPEEGPKQDCNEEMKDQGAAAQNGEEKSSSESANEDLAILKNNDDSNGKLKVDHACQLEQSLQNFDQAILLPQYMPKYSLLLATNHFYYVIKLIVTIYERLVFAKSLISEKVAQDLKKEAFGIIRHLTQKEQINFADDCKSERFNLFLKAVIGTVSQTPFRKLDSTSYEDIVRNLAGGKAFLLFVIDKPITQLLKNIPALKTYDECRKTLKLFQSFCKQADPSEYTYMVQFQSLMQTIPNFNGHCIRLLYSPLSGILCLHQFSLSPYPKMITTATGTHVQTNGNDNKTVVLGTQSAATFKTPETYVTTFVKDHLYEESEQKKEEPQTNNLDTDGEAECENRKLRMPVFLTRNRRIMKQIRKHLIDPKSVIDSEVDGNLTVENNLVIRQVPMICKIQYEANTTDTLLYKRRRCEAPPTEEQIVTQNFKRVLSLSEEIEKTRLRNLALLSSQEDHSEEKKEDSPEVREGLIQGGNTEMLNRLQTRIEETPQELSNKNNSPSKINTSNL